MGKLIETSLPFGHNEGGTPIRWRLATAGW